MGIVTKVKKTIPSWMTYQRDLRRYIRASGDSDRFQYIRKNRIPIYYDRYRQAGNLDCHYFIQDMYMAHKIISDGVQHLYDIGSRVDGFISHLLVGGVEVTMMDIRPLDVRVEGLSFIQTDAMRLDNIPDDSIGHLSSLHAVEHFGLGRYGDPIDVDGWRKALNAMSCKIQKNGMLYLSVPIGPADKLCFNAHRIFSPYTIIENVDKMILESFAWIHDYEVIESDVDYYMNNGSDYDCGLFVLRKI